MKKVLYLSYDGMTEALGESQVLPYLKGLSTIAQFHLLSFEKLELFEQNLERIQQLCDAAGITWHPQIYTKKPPVLSTLKDMRGMLALSKRLHNKFHFDLIHARSYLPAMVAQIMKRRNKIPFLFDMRGFWADERIDGGIWSLKNPLFNQIYRYFKRKEKELLVQADAIVSLTERGKKELNLLANNEDIELKTTVIPCCVQSKIFDPLKVNSEIQTDLRKELNIAENSFVLGYVGSIGTWYMLDEMLLCFKEFLLKKPNSIFLVVTKEKAAFIHEKALSFGIDTTKIKVRPSPHHLVPTYISLFSWAIFFIRPTFSKLASSPIKQGEIMAMGIPILTNIGVGDTATILAYSKAGICLSSLDSKSFSELDLDQFHVDPSAIREGALRYFDLEDGIKKYSEIYTRIWKK